MACNPRMTAAFYSETFGGHLIEAPTQRKFKKSGGLWPFPPPTTAPPNIFQYLAAPPNIFQHHHSDKKYPCIQAKFLFLQFLFVAFQLTTVHLPAFPIISQGLYSVVILKYWKKHLQSLKERKLLGQGLAENELRFVIKKLVFVHLFRGRTFLGKLWRSTVTSKTNIHFISLFKGRNCEVLTEGNHLVAGEQEWGPQGLFTRLCGQQIPIVSTVPDGFK